MNKLALVQKIARRLLLVNVAEFLFHDQIRNSLVMGFAGTFFLVGLVVYIGINRPPVDCTIALHNLSDDAANNINGLPILPWFTSHCLEEKSEDQPYTKNLTITVVYPDQMHLGNEASLKLRVSVPTPITQTQNVLIKIFTEDPYLDIDNSPGITRETTFWASAPAPTATPTPVPSPAATAAPAPAATPPPSSLEPINYTIQAAAPLQLTTASFCSGGTASPTATATPPPTATATPPPTATATPPPTATATPSPTAMVTPLPAQQGMSFGSAGWSNITLKYSKPCYLIVATCPMTTSITIKAEVVTAGANPGPAIAEIEPISRTIEIQVVSLPTEILSLLGIASAAIMWVMNFRQQIWRFFADIFSSSPG